MKTHKRLPGHRQMPNNQARSHFVAKAMEGDTQADVKHVNYLWNLAALLRTDIQAASQGEGARSWPIVEVWAHDGSWRVDLVAYRVEDDTQSVFTRVLAEYDWSGVEAQTVDLSGAVAEWAGPNHRYRVVRDGAVLKSGFSTEAEAIAWANARGAGIEAKVTEKKGK